MFAGTNVRAESRANRDDGAVLRIYRARRGSGQRSRRRCSTWARTGAHLREERPTGVVAAATVTVDVVVVVVVCTRRRGRPRVDTGSRPAPDIGSSCPAVKSAGGLLLPSFLSSFSFLLCLCLLFAHLLTRSLTRSLSRSHALSLARARESRNETRRDETRTTTAAAAAAFSWRTAAPGSPDPHRRPRNGV